MRRSFVLLAMFLAACDCGRTRTHAVIHEPKAVADPPEIRHELLCAPSEDALLVRNDGEEDLHVTAVSLYGAGWTLGPLDLPATVAPGASLEVALTAEDGAASLHVTSDDPKNPELVIPLAAHANTPPKLAFTAPASGAIVDEAQDLLVSATVSDEDAPEALAATWTATTTGELSHLPPGPDGIASVHWNAAGRPHGTQTVTLTVKDSCGAVSTAELPLCFDGAYSYEPFRLEGWHYEGTAAWDAAAGNLLLTPVQTSVVGSAFETSQQVGGENVDITFGFFMGNGTGADGFSLTALDVGRMTGFLGPVGCGIGYGGDSPCTSGPGLPGWSVEVDTYYNEDVDQTADDHVAFAMNGSLLNQPLWAALPEMEDTGWHTMKVAVHAPHVHVEIDGTTYLDGDVAADLHFPAYVGFTAATGGQTNEHRIRALNVEGHYCGG